MNELYRRIPPDLLIVLAWTVGTFILVIGDQNSIVRIIMGLVMVLFIPGYVLIAALFPKKNDLEGVERIALSFGLSIATVPLMGLLLNFTFGIRLLPILVTLCLFAISMIAIAGYRRNGLIEDERFSVPFRKVYDDIINGMRPKDRTDGILTCVLIITMIIAIGMIYFVITTPKIGERFTEFYVLDGKGKADDYATEISVGKEATYLIGVSNHEYRLVNYTVRANLGEDILGDEKLRLIHNQTWEKNMTIVPNKGITDGKLEFLLFKEDNFTEPYRKLHLWVNAT